MTEANPVPPIPCAILVATSDHDLGRSMAARLAEVGFGTAFTTTATQAMETINHGFRPDGVVLDLQQDDGQGLELYALMAQSGDS
jgi:DNA-binding NtrC family response regulator